MSPIVSGLQVGAFKDAPQQVHPSLVVHKNDTYVPEFELQVPADFLNIYLGKWLEIQVQLVSVRDDGARLLYNREWDMQWQPNTFMQSLQQSRCVGGSNSAMCYFSTVASMYVQRLVPKGKTVAFRIKSSFKDGGGSSDSYELVILLLLRTFNVIIDVHPHPWYPQEFLGVSHSSDEDEADFVFVPRSILPE